MKSLDRLIRRSSLAFVAGLLLFFSFVIYSGGHAVMRRAVDAQLLERAKTLGQLLERRPDLLSAADHDFVPEEFSGTRRKRLEMREAAHFVGVFAADGRLLWRGSDATPALALQEGIREPVSRHEPVFETVRQAEGFPFRRGYVPIPEEGPVQYVLQIETSLLPYEETLNGLTLLLAVALGTTVFIAWRGGAWLAGRVLAPIETVTLRAEAISTAKVGDRLSLDSPYREFSRLTQAFNAVIDKFQRSSETQRHFVDYAAHEMQTPLTVLRGNLEVVLQKARTTDEYREALIGNLAQVEKLITLARSLLTLTKFTGANPPFQLASLSLEPLLQDLVEELAVLADDGHITLSLDAQPVPRILGDALWLKQALFNLLGNAFRYTPPGGSVTVRLQRHDNQVVIAIEDTGQGIEPEHLPHLFDRFYRTDRARARNSGGTGLGLPIAQGIIEAHRGTIEVTSQVDKGSIFTIRLPALAA